jgi:hypothetical protein
MTESSGTVAQAPPRWVWILAFTVSIAALGALLLLDEPHSPASPSLVGWLVFVLFAVPAYVLLTFAAEAALDILLGSRRWLVRAIPLLLILGFYVLWFWRVFR